MGDNSIHYLSHVKMMAANTFLSGAISKTVNMPESATVEDIEQLHIDSWKMGLKALAIYRDNCKVAQPLSQKDGDERKVKPPPAFQMMARLSLRALYAASYRIHVVPTVSWRISKDSSRLVSMPMVRQENSSSAWSRKVQHWLD
jgi:ribonucleotide reductase alpha subunit